MSASAATFSPTTRQAARQRTIISNRERQAQLQAEIQAALELDASTLQQLPGRSSERRLDPTRWIHPKDDIQPGHPGLRAPATAAAIARTRSRSRQP